MLKVRQKHFTDKTADNFTLISENRNILSAL